MPRSTSAGNRIRSRCVCSPKRALHVRPSFVRLKAAAGAEISAELIVLESAATSRTGSRPRAVVFFEESYWVGRALVFALREADADEGVQRYLDRVVHELRATMAPTTTIVYLHPASEHLAPGQETMVRIAATLPVELAKGRTYVATFALAGTDVRIEIDVNGAANSTKRRPA